MKPITIEDRELFIGKTDSIINSEYQFSTMFIWQEIFGFQYVAYKNTLLVFGYQHNGNLQCYYPLGPDEEFDGAVSRIIEIFHSQGLPVNFRPLSENMKNNLHNRLGLGYSIGTKTSYTDYIYDFEKLRSYNGPEYKRKRKAWNRFSSMYDYEYETITISNQNECFHALKRIICEQTDYDHDEVNAYERIFSNYSQLNLRGGLLRINGVVEAVAVGESIGDMVLIHLKRANKQYIGIYPSIFKLLLDNEFNDRQYKIVNSEDDMGMERIRDAKLSYKPILLLQKFFIEEMKL